MAVMAATAATAEPEVQAEPEESEEPEAQAEPEDPEAQAEPDTADSTLTEPIWETFSEISSEISLVDVPHTEEAAMVRCAEQT